MKSQNVQFAYNKILKKLAKAFLIILKTFLHLIPLNLLKKT